MIIASLCASLAVWLAWPVTARERLEPLATKQQRRIDPLWGGAGITGAVLTVLLAQLIGPGSAVALVCGVGTAAIVVRHRRRAKQSWQRRRAVADACQALASEVASGRAPVLALTSVATELDVLAEGAAHVFLGGDPCAGWQRQAEQPGCAGLSRLAAAWQVCVRTGAPLAPSLESVASSLRADQELAQTVDQELAAARATGRVMALLPAVGLLLGYAMGGDPVAFLIGEGWGQLCLAVGVVLACAGLLWSERLVNQAGQQ